MDLAGSSNASQSALSAADANSVDEATPVWQWVVVGVAVVLLLAVAAGVIVFGKSCLCKGWT